jgi:hypothetical protein
MRHARGGALGVPDDTACAASRADGARELE